MNADIQETTDGRFAVTAGRSDEITDPQIDKGDRDEQKLRAKYVHAAVDGRKVKSGKTTSIPIPATRDGVEQLVAVLERDQSLVTTTSIADLEDEIDEVVYDMFGLDADEQAVIEEYMEVF